MRARRPLLAFVLGAIAVTAILGLWAVLSSDFGELQGKVLATSAAISAASILVLGCAPAWERGFLVPLPLVAAGLALLALVLLVFGIWAEADWEDYWSVFGTVLMLAVWGVLTCLLVLARLAPRYRWTFFSAAGLTLLLTVLGVVALWDGSTSDAFARLAGAVGVLSAAFVVAVPVLSRASRPEEAVAERATCCPRCGRTLEGAHEGPCPGCGARFRVRFL